MGQAKQRGTAGERAEQARARQREGREPIDIDVLRKEQGVPNDAEFVGFVVWLRERDEFLVHLRDLPDRIERGYGPLVDKAVLFDTWDTAAPHADASKHPATVAAAFDLGSKIIVIGN
jgi:hypothetical protein